MQKTILSIIIIMLLTVVGANAQSNIAQGEVGTCVWYITQEGELVIAPADSVSGGDLPSWNYYNYAPWHKYANDITTAKIESGVNTTSCSYLFYELSKMTSIDLSNFNTQNVTSMSYMFAGCKKLTSLDLSNFNTQKVTGMVLMFDGCSALTSLDLSNFNTQNVTSMYAMFYDCSSLTSLDLSNFNTENVTNMYYMFYGCSSLTSLDLSSFNTQNVMDMYGMFEECYAMTELNLSNFTNINVETAESIFSGCDNLTTIISNNETPSPLKVGAFDSFEKRDSCTLLVPTGTKALYAAADGWNELGNIDDGTTDELAEGDVFEYEGLWYKVTSAENMTAAVIKNQSTTPYTGDVVVPQVTIYGDYGFTVTALADSCFFICKEITSVSIAPTVKTLGDCSFKLCENLTNVNIPESVTEIGPRCFSYCYSLNNAVIPSGVSELKKATFYGCENLTSVTIPEGVTALGEMCFHGCVTLPSVVIPSTVTTIEDYCFWACDTLMKVTNLALVPQEITESTFCRYDTLCVNPESTAAYKAAEYWNLFYIEGDEDEPAYADDVYGTQILVLTSEKPFYNSGNYMAERVTYTRNFTKQTPKGGNAGWETIVLPFNVQRIASAKGQLLAPFGSFEAESGIALPFWLAEYTEDGSFKHATSIRANIPYIIAMPNSDDYNQKYCVSGTVTFAAQNVEIHKSEDAVSVEGNGYTFTPTYNFVEPAHNIFAINHESYSRESLFLPGSIFLEESSTVKPFEAYLSVPEYEQPYAANRRYVRIVTDSNVADGIYEVLTGNDAANGKFLQNGKLIIRKNGAKFNATGVQMK